MHLITDKKARAASLSICSNTLLILLKITAGVLSGSVSIISEAIHSSLDLLAALITFFSVRASNTPADEVHPYGHGKIENVSGVIEGLLIFVAAALIVKEALHKIASPTLLSDTNIGIVVMVISALVNAVVAKKLYQVAKEEDSIALEADALHLKTDIYTSIGVAVGILLIKLTGYAILDPIAAILVAILILKESYHLCANAFGPLIDVKLSDDEINKITHIIDGYKGEIIDFHKLRTRKAGNTRYVDFHLTVNGNMSVKVAHALSDRILLDIKKILSHASIHIHIEPPKGDG